MIIYEGTMSEIDQLVQDYKMFCKKEGKKPTVRSCVDYIMINSDLVNNDGDNEAELLNLVSSMIIDDDEFNEAMETVKKFGYKVVKEANERL
ncbi:MAG: hypothetical protein J6T10_01520 [Methanobrevibacter sp.]|nr:hypothetical protein [Methanobrevibacter sp.]